MLGKRKKLGKYRVEKRLDEGGFATVYRAYDTIEGIRVALKVPHPQLLTSDALESFRREARMAAQLDHPNVLQIKTAGFVDDVFVIVYPLGESTLAERLQRRIGATTAIGYAEQMLSALAHAHSNRIIHCDIKPENFILFPHGRLRLADFGIAKLALSTRNLDASGTGSVGYVAPEQALGKPSFRSDVFSMGLVLYRMFSGRLPEWPYDWPPPGLERLRQTVHPDFIEFLVKAMQVDESRRFADGIQMLAAFSRIRSRALKPGRTRRRKPRREPDSVQWQSVRFREFRRLWGRELDARAQCPRCGGPFAEHMRYCPWCGTDHRTYRGPTGFPARCPRCRRGVKLDWRFCAWCYGGAIGPLEDRAYSDRRYSHRCHNPACERRDLMPFMSYCPWCNRKVRRKWPIPGARSRCKRCGRGSLPEFWGHCPWCGLTQKTSVTGRSGVRR